VSIAVHPPPRRRAARRGTGRFVALGTALGFIVAALMVLGYEPVLPGGQAAGPAAHIGRAPPGGWDAMPPSIAGDGRAGFPEPMVHTGPQLCVGFGRVDFPATQRRPSLARCVDTADLPRSRNLLVVLDSTDSGLDTWHFLVVGGEVADVRAIVAGGDELDGARIHVGGPVIALRLADGTVFESLEWTTEFGRFRCDPPPDAWSTGTFCAQEL
jgi:hypothetical protein